VGAYGWKATIGFLGPPRTNETVLHEAFRLAPDGVAWCWSVMGLPEFGQYEFDEALRLAALCAKELADRDVSIIVATGIPLIASKGPGYHEALERELSAAINHRKPVTSDIRCVMSALAALGLNDIVISSLYQGYIQDNVIRYFAQYGIRTLADERLSFALADCMTKPTMDTAYESALVADAKAPAAQGMFIACPQWPVVGNLDRLEQKIKKPVVAHLPAIMWGALSQLGVREPRPGYGTLLADWPAWVDRPARTAATSSE
jgi:maleate cis-trans isomerase